MHELLVNLDTIRELAEKRRDEFEVLRYRIELDEDLSDKAVDALVAELARPIIQAIDCTQCANCCRALSIQVGMDDMEWLGYGLGTSTEKIIAERVVLQNAEDEPHVLGTFREQPCHYLDGNLCSVYAHRPEACRVYPQFTPDFRWTLEWVVDGARICPIIYNLLSILAEKIDEIQQNL